MRLVLPGDAKGNLVCDRFPPELARLTRLVELDLSANYLIGTLEDVSAVLVGTASVQQPTALSALTSLYLSSNLLEGTVPASLLTVGDGGWRWAVHNLM